MAALAARHRRVLSPLTALTYDLDPLIATRAVEAIGLAAGTIADTDAEYMRNHLRRLFWLLNDESGGIGWRAPEAIGEILRARPHAFPEFVLLLVSLLDMEPEDAPRFRLGTLRAIGRVAEVAPEIMRGAVAAVRPFLADADPTVHSMAMWALSHLWANESGRDTPK